MLIPEGGRDASDMQWDVCKVKHQRLILRCDTRIENSKIKDLPLGKLLTPAFPLWNPPKEEFFF